MVAGSRDDAEALWAEVSGVLAPIGLRLSEQKTGICHIDEGFDFLGWRIQRRARRGRGGARAVYTYPSKKALLAILDKVRRLTRREKHRRLADLLRRLNPVLRGWCTYFRHGVSSRTFSYVDHFAFWRIVGWIRKRHHGLNWGTIRRRYLPAWEISDGATTLYRPRAVRDRALPLPGSPDRNTMGEQRHDPVESRMRGDVHVRFGGRAEETGRPKGRHRASARPLHLRAAPGRAGSTWRRWSTPAAATASAGRCATTSQADLVYDALGMAVTRRRPDADLVHHSDRGSQYRSPGLRQAAAESGIMPSMGSRGDAYDNAAMESFMASIKTELINRRRFKTKDEARTAIFAYIEAFYNPRRRHKGLGQKSPAVYEKMLKTAQLEATTS